MAHGERAPWEIRGRCLFWALTGPPLACSRCPAGVSQEASADEPSVTLLHESPAGGAIRAALCFPGLGAEHAGKMLAPSPHGAEAGASKSLHQKQSSLCFTGRDSSLFNASPVPSTRLAHAPQKSSPFSINASSISPHAAPLSKKGMHACVCIQIRMYMHVHTYVCMIRMYACMYV